MPFSIIKCEIAGPVIIEPKVFEDERGFFLESYKKSDFENIGINLEFRQDNHSLSSIGVIRGLHYQKNPYAQAKLVRVVKGRVWDVAVDIRKNSPSYKKWIAVELSGENRKMFLYLKVLPMVLRHLPRMYICFINAQMNTLHSTMQGLCGMIPNLVFSGRLKPLLFQRKIRFFLYSKMQRFFSL